MKKMKTAAQLTTEIYEALRPLRDLHIRVRAQCAFRVIVDHGEMRIELAPSPQQAELLLKIEEASRMVVKFFVKRNDLAEWQGIDPSGLIDQRPLMEAVDEPTFISREEAGHGE